MKNTEARKTLGLDPSDDPSAFMPAFEETIAYKKELIENAPSPEIKFRYQQELLEYEAAVKVVAAKAKIRPHTDFMIVLFVIAAFCAVAWWGYGWYQQQWNEASENDIRIAHLQTIGRIAVDKRKWQDAENAYKEIQTIDPESTIAKAGFASIERGKDVERSQQVFYNLGESQAALEAGRWDEAERLVKLVLKADPENTTALRKMELIQRGKRKQVISNKILALTDALEAKNLTASQTALADLKKADPQNANLDEFAKRVDGLDVERKKREAKALALLEHAKKLDTGEYSPKAMVLLSEALRLLPGNSDIKELHKKMGSYTQALKVPVDYPTISKAIAAARPRDVIRVSAGTYQESLTLDKILRIEGSPDGKTIIELPGAKGSLVTVNKPASGSMISNLTLRHKGFDHGETRFSGVTVNGAQVVISGCVVEKATGHGIAVIDGAKARLTGCTVTGSGWDGISVYGKGTTVEITDGLSRDNIQNGIGLWNGGAGTIKNTLTLKNGLCGILAMSQGTEVTIESNTCSHNRDAGILVSDGVKALLKLNKCEKNLLSGIVVRGEGTTADIISNATNGNHEAGILTHTSAAIGKFEKNQAKGNVSQQIWRNADLK
ncbi:MAG: right-handed parallel beta-helix repeat-containing protein [Akkermansiaceae bacterium]